MSSEVEPALPLLEVLFLILCSVENKTIGQWKNSEESFQGVEEIHMQMLGKSEPYHPDGVGVILFTCMQACLHTRGSLSSSEKQSIPEEMMGQAHQATLQTEMMNRVQGDWSSKCFMEE